MAAVVRSDLQTPTSVSLVTGAADVRVWATPLVVEDSAPEAWLLARLESGAQHGGLEVGAPRPRCITCAPCHQPFCACCFREGARALGLSVAAQGLRTFVSS